MLLKAAHCTNLAEKPRVQADSVGLLNRAQLRTLQLAHGTAAMSKAAEVDSAVARKVVDACSEFKLPKASEVRRI